MKRLLVLLSLAAAFALVACQNQGSRESGQGTQSPGQTGSQAEPGSDVRTAYPDEEDDAATDQPGQRQRGSMANPDEPGSIGSPDPSEPQNQPGSDSP
jgi:hypothetical protein